MSLYTGVAFMKVREPVLVVQSLTGTSWKSPNLYFPEVKVECWGKGGSGGRALVAVFISVGKSRGGGGGGGAYASSILSLLPNTTYSINIPSTTQAGDCWFGSPTTVLAKNGSPGAQSSQDFPLGSGGTGGDIALSVGDIKYAGGQGSNAPSSIYAGGGGGSLAGTLTNGNSATDQYGALHVASDPWLGNGGNGGVGSGTGVAGYNRGGGGGGGSCQDTNASYNGGAGAPGAIRLTYYI